MDLFILFSQFDDHLGVFMLDDITNVSLDKNLSKIDTSTI